MKRAGRPFRKHILVITSICATTLGAVGTPAQADLADDILELTDGTRTKLVWIQGSDIKGFDTQSGEVETILSGQSKPGRPFVTSDGKRIVFHTGGKADGIKDFGDTHKVWITDWSGGERQELVSDGYLCSIWEKEDTEYAIIMKSDRETYLKISLNGEIVETVLSGSGGGRGELQLSSDGQRGCHGMGTGWIDFTKNPPDIHGGFGGCRPSMAPDNSYRWFRFYSPHVKVKMFDKDENTWDVQLPEAGSEAYYPRWTNDPVFMTHTGHGRYSKAFLCRFATDFKSIEKSVMFASGGEIYHPSARIGIRDDQTGAKARTSQSVRITAKSRNSRVFEVNGRIIKNTGSAGIGATGLKILEGRDGRTRLRLRYR